MSAKLHTLLPKSQREKTSGHISKLSEIFSGRNIPAIHIHTNSEFKLPPLTPAARMINKQSCDFTSDIFSKRPAVPNSKYRPRLLNAASFDDEQRIFTEDLPIGISPLAASKSARNLPIINEKFNNTIKKYKLDFETKKLEAEIDLLTLLKESKMNKLHQDDREKTNSSTKRLPETPFKKPVKSVNSIRRKLKVSEPRSMKDFKL